MNMTIKTKTKYLNYARHRAKGWMYVWIKNAQGGIGLHELYPSDGELSWCENPEELVDDSYITEILGYLRDGIVFTEEKLFTPIQQQAPKHPVKTPEQVEATRRAAQGK